MKIIHVKAADTYLEEQRRFVDLVCALSEVSGIEQHILMHACPDLEALFDKHKITYQIEKFGGMFDLRTQKAIQDSCANFLPHIVQVHSAESAMLISKLKHKCVRVGFLHDDIEQNEKIRAQTDLTLSAHHPYNQDPLDDHILSVPPLIYNQAQESTPIDKGDFDTAEDKPLIGTMLELSEQYDLQKLFQAVKEISGLHFWIIGTGKEKKSLENEARKHAVHDKVKFIEDYGNWLSLIKSLDFCVVPFRSAGADRFTFEAWLCEKAVLSAMPEDRSPVTHEVDGIYLDKNDRLEWKSKIEMLLSEEEKRKELALAGHKTFLESFSHTKVIKYYLQAYEAALRLMAKA